MRRSEFLEELNEVAKAGFDSQNGAVADPASRRLLNWFDQNAAELEYVGSLRLNLKTVVAEKVNLEIEVAELQQKLEHALRTRKEAGETDDD